MVGKYVIKDERLYQIVAKHPDDKRWLLEDIVTDRVMILDDRSVKQLKVVVPSAA